MVSLHSYQSLVAGLGEQEYAGGAAGKPQHKPEYISR